LPRPARFQHHRHAACHGAVRKFRDEKAELPEAANGRLKAVRQVFKWAVEAGHAERNPAADVPYIKTGSEVYYAVAKSKTSGG
jgi:site-specific recombinase XerD